MTEILLTSLGASLWCLGIWTVTEPGKLLDFLRQPLVNYIDERKRQCAIDKEKHLKEYQEKAVLIDEYKERARAVYHQEIKRIDGEFKRFKFRMKFLNPILLCPACMGSVHGFICFAVFHPVTWHVIPVMLITSGLNHIWHEKAF